MTLESAGITDPAQLDGKTVGITGVPSDEALLGTILEEVGLSIDDVELVNVGFDLMPALLSEQVDAIIGAYWVHESILADQQGAPVAALRVEELGVPDYYELLLVASDELIADRPEVVDAFVRALARGYADAEADPDAAVDALVAAYPETAEEVEREGIHLLIPYWTDEGSVAWGTQTDDRWTAYADWLRDNDILTDDVDVSAAWTNEFVED
jgi:putative hydroxymethylpyrimidine transport system substrate-binding protein